MRDPEALRDIAVLLSRAADGTPGTRYTCGKLYAQTTLVGGFYPAVAVYGHTLTSGQPPRLLDAYTANLLSGLLAREYDADIAASYTEAFPGSLADWRVVRPGREDGDDE